MWIISVLIIYKYIKANKYHFKYLNKYCKVSNNIMNNIFINI